MGFPDKLIISDTRNTTTVAMTMVARPFAVLVGHRFDSVKVDDGVERTPEFEEWYRESVASRIRS